MADLEALVARLERRVAELEAKIADLPLGRPVSFAVHEIVLMAAFEWRVSAIDIYGDRRFGLLAEPRQAVAWVARMSLPYSLPRIGRALNRDHTTIIHALRQAERRRPREPRFRRATDAMVAAMARKGGAALDALAEATAAPELELVGAAA